MTPVSVARHWKKKWLIALLSLLVGATVLGVAGLALLSTSYFKQYVVDFAAARTGRQIKVEGPLEVRFLSSRPSLTAQNVTIGNPPWMPPGVTAHIGKLSVAFDFPLPARSSSIQRLEMTDATLHLVRDSEGRANWQWSAPGTPRRGPSRLVRSLSMPNARVDLDDARRHVQFNGIVTAQDVRESGPTPPLRIEGTGQLNGRAAAFAINADPLATARRDRPYRFAFVERSGEARLSGRGALLQPFNPGVLDTTFQGSGPSMKEAWFLVGMSLPNTAPAKVSGKLARRGPRSTFTDLLANFGESDVRGSVVSQTVSGRIRFDADLNSHRLRLADFGRQDTGPAPAKTAAKGLLLPDTQLPLAGLRRRLGSVHVRADTIAARSMSLHAVDSKATVDHDVLTISSFAGRLHEGEITGSAKVDVTGETAKTDLDLRIAGLQLSRLSRKGLAQPPFEGALSARLQITGRGNSPHQLAASADGALTAVVPHGAMRASLAELTGLNLRGIGLMLARNDEETPVRCAVASFQAREGTLSAQHFIIDTESVLITGTGSLDLDSEALDLTLRGQPKKVRLVRVRSPLYVRGVLAHPSFSMSTGRVVAQTGGAVALGIAFTPIAAVLALVDPGLAKDADCSALRQQVRADFRERALILRAELGHYRPQGPEGTQ